MKLTSEQLIQELEQYRSELTKIMGRFVRSHNSLSIHREDDPRYRTYVIEIIDLLNDTIGKNQYSPLINQLFNEGISNFIQSPSYKSIEDIISVLDSVVTRLKRNPDFFIKKEEPVASIKTELKPPDKMTLKWLWEHTPPDYVWKFLLLLFFVFSLGITFAQTRLYKSLIDIATTTPNPIKQDSSSAAVKK